MAFYYGDTFDAYGSDQLTKWDNFGGPFSGITAGAGRNGTNGLTFFDNGRALKAFPVCSGWLAAFAFKSIVVDSSLFTFVASDGVGNSSMVLTVGTNSLGGFYALIPGNTPSVSAGSLFVGSSWGHLQIQVTATGTGGIGNPQNMFVTFSVYFNNVLVLSGSGTVSGVRSTGINYLGFLVNAGGQVWAFDDFYLKNSLVDGDIDPDGDLRGLALLPDGVGAYSDWTTSPSASINFQMVYENPDDQDATYVYTRIPGAMDSYRFPDVSLPVSAHIYGVQQNVVARKDNAGSRLFAPTCRPTTATFQGASYSVGDTYDTYWKMWNHNPDTGIDWTQAQFNAGEWGEECTG